MSLLDFVIKNTAEYIETKPKSQRKKYGQFCRHEKSPLHIHHPVFSIPHL